jgi:hypothetical protein
VKDGFEVHFVEHYGEVFDIALKHDEAKDMPQAAAAS